VYGVGLRIGPSFINSLKGDGLKFTFLPNLSSFRGLGIVVAGTRWLALPIDAAGGIPAGSQTYAVSGILLTVFGYFAMVLPK
jgi:putative transport protein